MMMETTSNQPSLDITAGPPAAPAATVTQAWVSKWLAPTIAAFIDVVEPGVARLPRNKRWIALETENGDLEFYRTGARNVLLGQGSTLDDKARRNLRAEKSSEIELRLLPERLTQTSIKIPAGGLDYIEQIIESRLDRLTPWKPEKVLYGFASATKAGTDGQFDVDIVATSREIAASSIIRLEAFGLIPSTMGSAAEPMTQRLRIDLFRGRNDNARKSRRKRIAFSAVIVLSISVLAYLASLYATANSSQDLGDLDQQTANARRMLVQGSSSLADRQKGFDLVSTKTPQYARFALIDRLAGLIPDNTYLDELEIQQGNLRIAGTSTEASALIKILESEPILTDARFSAPVTRQEDGRDRFDISATLRKQKNEPAQ